MHPERYIYQALPKPRPTFGRTGAGWLTNTRRTFQIYQLRFFRVNPKQTFVISPQKRHRSFAPRSFAPRSIAPGSFATRSFSLYELPNYWLASRLKVLR